MQIARVDFMQNLELPPIPKEMTSRPWKRVFLAGAFFSWALLVYALYFV